MKTNRGASSSGVWRECGVTGLVCSFIPQTWCRTGAHGCGPRWPSVCSNRLVQGHNAGPEAPSLGPAEGLQGVSAGREIRKDALCQAPGGETFRRAEAAAPHNGRLRCPGPAATPPPHRPGQYLVVLLPAARWRRRPTRAAGHVHVQGAGERAPQRPHPLRQPHGRQAEAQPARQQSHQGKRPLSPITAGAEAKS